MGREADLLGYEGAGGDLRPPGRPPPGDKIGGGDGVGSDSLATIRQRVLAAAHKEVSTQFDFSYNPLPKTEKDLLHRMAAFASSATEFVIELACTHLDFAGDEALPRWRDDLTELVRKSFVDTLDLSALDESGNEITFRRYRLHPLMRQYASGKAGEEAMNAHRRRAANLFLAYAGAFEDNYDALQAEHENILAGMDWAYAAEEWEMVRSFVSATDIYLKTRGYWIEDKIRLEQVTKACVNLGDKSGVAKSLHQLGMLAQNTGEVGEARRLYGESLKIAQELGDNSSSVAHHLNSRTIISYSEVQTNSSENSKLPFDGILSIIILPLQYLMTLTTLIRILIIKQP